MRATIIDGVEDDIRINCGSDVMLVGTVIEIGHAISDLTYEVQLTGEEVLDIFNKIRRPGELDDIIDKSHHYILTAFDD